MTAENQMIEDLLRELRHKTRPQTDERILSDCFAAAENNGSSTISKSRRFRPLIRFAAAAIVVWGVCWVLFYPNCTPRLYAMSDLPRLLRQAKTVHIQGWLISPLPGQSVEEMPRRPFEYWFDPLNERMQIMKTGNIFNGTETKPVQEETVIDGSVLMRINHTDRTVQYGRLSDFSRRFMIRQNFDTILRQVFLTLRTAGRFHKTGVQRTGGIEYELWEGTWTLSSPDAPKMMMSARFDPRTGNLSRMKIQPEGEDRTFGMIEILTMERNIEIPDELFSLTPPAEYTTLSSDQETGREANELSIAQYHYDPYILHLHTASLLNDGSVLLCWRVENTHEQTSWSEAFEPLTAGGPLPNLPVTIEKLTPLISSNPAPYPGVHLLTTEKNGTVYEWSLYVPFNPRADNPIGFKIIPSFQEPPPQKLPETSAMISTAFMVEDERDFEEFVIGAMQYFCDDECIPEGFDYPFVLSVSNRVRARLSGTAQ